MTRARCSYAVTAILMAACAVDPSQVPSAQPADQPASGARAQGRSADACPLGATTLTRSLGLSDEVQPLDLAVDSAGNVVFAAGIAANGGELSGVVSLSPAGEPRFTLPYGSVVATDSHGNAYVAGAFTQPIDLGLGMMQPRGTPDLFVARVDAAGQVRFAKQLGISGEGVKSLAVDADGRIAISGAAMGTAVVTPGGEIDFQLPYGGAVAFDTHGNLVVVGSFASIDLGDGLVTAKAPGRDVFVSEVDTTGRRVFSHIMPNDGTQSAATAVAIGGHDEVVLVGYTAGSIDLLGTTVTAAGAGLNLDGRVSGAFAVELDAAGKPTFVRDLAITEANGVAIDATGRIVINGALTGGEGFLRRVTLQTFDPAGNRIDHLDEFIASGYGRGYAVGVDACGSIYAAFVAFDTPSRQSALRSYVVKRGM